MKKLKVDKLTFPDTKSVYIEKNKYSIWLGNSANNSFTSEKKAKKFLAETNRFINLTLQELNLIYIDVFKEYRRLWFVIPNDASIEHSLNNITRHFRYIIKYNKSTNNNAYSFIDMVKICYELTTIINELIDVCIIHKNFLLVNYIKTLKKRVEIVNDTIDKYGKQN